MILDLNSASIHSSSRSRDISWEIPCIFTIGSTMPKHMHMGDEASEIIKKEGFLTQCFNSSRNDVLAAFFF